MVQDNCIKSYEEFENYTKSLKDEKNVFFYFSGSKDKNGISWCPDCQRAEPVVRKVLDTKISKNINFVYVDVGDRSTFKDLKCPFRLNKKTNIQVIPTLLRWNTVQRLEGDQCLNEDLLQMFFTENED